MSVTYATTFATPINNFADTRLKFIRIDARAIILYVTKVSDPAQHYFDKWMCDII